MSVNIYNSNPNATSEEENFSRVADRGSKLASDTIYSNTTSGLTSVNVQGAIDEVNEKVEDNIEAISQINSELTLKEDEITFISNWGGSKGELKERNNIFSFWFQYQTGLSTNFTTGIIASLPSGFRPSTIKRMPCVKIASNGLTPNGYGFVVVDTNGDITYYGDAVAFQEYILTSGEFIN